LVVFKLEKQLGEVKKAGWREKMGMLHWGICAVVAYYTEYCLLADSVGDIERMLVTRRDRRGRMFEDDDPRPVPLLPVSGPTKV